MSKDMVDQSRYEPEASPHKIGNSSEKGNHEVKIQQDQI